MLYKEENPMPDKLINKKNLTRLSCVLLLFAVFVAVTTAKPLNIFKINNIFGINDNILDIVQISDVHLDSKSKSHNQRMIEYSTDLLKDAISRINNSNDVQMVVFSGDVVNRPDKNDFLKFVSIANNLKVPWYYAPGNHDPGILGGLSKSKILEILNEKLPYFNVKSPYNNYIYYSYSPNRKFLVLFLDGVILNKITANGYFPIRELDWLNRQIKNNPDKKVIIVKHFPVVEPYKSTSHRVANADEYLNIIDRYTNVIAVLSGHYHATKITQRKNVLHISTPALAEYPNAYREIKITDLNDSTRFDIKLIETNLKDIQQLSKSRLKNPDLTYGQPKDRNTTITLVQKH
jgi:3',5'-cyclic-AMP phosphodiesterase